MTNTLARAFNPYFLQTDPIKQNFKHYFWESCCSICNFGWCHPWRREIVTIILNHGKKWPYVGSWNLKRGNGRTSKSSRNFFPRFLSIERIIVRCCCISTSVTFKLFAKAFTINSRGAINGISRLLTMRKSCQKIWSLYS